MSIRAEIEDALEEMEGDLSPASDGVAETFRWKTKEIPCCVSALGRAVILEDSGNMIEIQLTLTVRTSEFLSADSTLTTIDSELVTLDNETPRPVSGNLVKVRGTPYRVRKATISPSHSHITLHLADPNAVG